MQGIKAIFFDGYQTLIYARDPFGRHRQAMRGAGCEASDEALAAALRQEMKHYRDHCHEARDAMTLAALRLECARVFLDELRFRGAECRLTPAAVVEALLNSFVFDLYDDVRPALQALRAAELTLGVISNFDYRLPQLLTQLGIGMLFDFVLTSAEVASKPEPLIFERALELAGVEPREAWHVGDEWEVDVVGASHCGIAPVYLARNGESAPAATRTIRSLSELVPLLRE